LEFNVPFQHKYGYIRDERLYRKQLAKVKVGEHYQNGFQLRKESDKVGSFLRNSLVQHPS